jgi:hypothetical protein
MKSRGMLSLEVCILLALVTAGLLAMEIYFRQALQGNWRLNADSFSDEQYNWPDDEEIDPGVSREYSLSGARPFDIILSNPRLTPEIVTKENQGKQETIDLASSTPGDKFLRIKGWGNFK